MISGLVNIIKVARQSKASTELETTLYVKAGSIVPMGQKIQYTSERKDPIELRIYPGADARFELIF